MPNGRFGRANLTANTDTSIYTCPASTVATANVSFVNRNTSGVALIRLAISDSGSPNVADYLEFDFPLAAGESLERTGMPMTAAEQIIVRASVAGVSVRAGGFEQGA